MPRSSKRVATRSSAGAKKQKTDSAGVEEEKDTTSVAVSPVAEPEPASSSPQVKTEEEEPSSEDHKFVLQVLANVKKDPIRLDVVESSFGLLKRLVQSNDDEDLMKCIVDADGISVVATIMKENPDDWGLQMECRALLDLLCDVVDEKPEKEGIEAILLVMKTLPGDAVLQTKCCEILRGAARSGLHEFIGEAGGIPLILVALKNRPNQEELLENCLGALVNLTFQSENNRKRVADAGGIAVVVDTLRRHKDNSIVKNGVKVLQNVSCNSKERKKSIIEAGGHVAVITFMTNHPQDEVVQRSGCWALANLAWPEINEVNKKMVDAGAIPAVVKAMKQHPTNVEVQRGGCHFFEWLSNGGDDILAAMNEAGVLPVLGSAIQAHPSSKNIKAWSKKAWNRLVDSFSSD